jgi:hypothetical protein
MPQTNYNFLNCLDLEKDVIIRVSRLLDNIEKGNSNIYISPLGSNLDPELILFGWDSIFNSNSMLLCDDLLTLENLNRSKFGPRSLAIPWSSRRDSVYEYFSPDKCSVRPDQVGAGPRRLRPISRENAMSYLKNSTNSGLPFFARKGEVKDILDSDFTSLLARRDDCVMFTRTQESNKTRTVWGYPCCDVLNEMRFYRPLLQYQRRLNWRSALLGPDAVDSSIDKLIRRARSNGEELLSVDFSQYDATVKTQLQEGAFNYIRDMYLHEYQDEISYIANRFNTIGLITPDGVLGGPHGVPSGSTFTNEVDSIVQFQCAISSGISPDQFDIQGDDGVYSLMDPHSLKERFKEYGLEVNDEKSYMSDKSVVYLQNLHTLDHKSDDGKIRGIYPTYRALNRIIYQERFNQFSDDNILGADFYAIKTICILENCRNHPLFPELVKFVMKLDKFKLQYTQYGLQQYIQRIKKTSGIEGIIINKPEDLVSGLNTFKTVQLLSKLY